MLVDREVLKAGSNNKRSFLWWLINFASDDFTGSAGIEKNVFGGRGVWFSKYRLFLDDWDNGGFVDVLMWYVQVWFVWL